MVATINSFSLPAFSLSMPSALSNVQKATQDVFSHLKERFEQFKNSLDFHPLRQPGTVIEGGFWMGFWCLSTLFSAMSLHELYTLLTVELPADERFNKISLAAKNAFVDLVSWSGATVFNFHWAHDAKILSLGRYTPLFQGLGYGSSLIINVVEGGWSIYNLYTEKEEILKATNADEQEMHKQRMCLALMKVAGNVSMIAWTALGIATVATGCAMSSLLSTALLTLGCVFSLSAFFYQRHIEKAPELCPIPSLQTA